MKILEKLSDKNMIIATTLGLIGIASNFDMVNASDIRNDPHFQSFMSMLASLPVRTVPSAAEKEEIRADIVAHQNQFKAMLTEKAPKQAYLSNFICAVLADESDNTNLKDIQDILLSIPDLNTGENDFSQQIASFEMTHAISFTRTLLYTEHAESHGNIEQIVQGIEEAIDNDENTEDLFNSLKETCKQEKARLWEECKELAIPAAKRNIVAVHKLLDLMRLINNSDVFAEDPIILENIVSQMYPIRADYTIYDSLQANIHALRDQLAE